MKIVILTHYFAPHVGGIEVVAEEHARRLAARGHDVTVVTTDIDADESHEFRDGYELVRYAAFNPLEERGMPYPIPAPFACANVVRRVVDDSVDVLHVHGFNYLTSLVSLLSLHRRDIPVLLHQHTPFVDYSPALNVLQTVNDNTVGRGVIHSADYCLAVSDNIAAYTSKLGGEPVRVLYNGVDVDRFSPDVAPSENEFLYIGRLTQKKGLKRLLETIEILDGREVDTTVRIAGKGELAPAVENASSAEILEYEGFVSPERLPALYSRARALLVPNQAGDAFPTLTVLEALASGTPAILVQNDISAPGFVNGETYLQAEPTPTSLADHICELAADDALAERMATNCRTTAVDMYQWDSRIDELEQVYRQLL